MCLLCCLLRQITCWRAPLHTPLRACRTPMHCFTLSQRGDNKEMKRERRANGWLGQRLAQWYYWVAIKYPSPLNSDMVHYGIKELKAKENSVCKCSDDQRWLSENKSTTRYGCTTQHCAFGGGPIVGSGTYCVHVNVGRINARLTLPLYQS